jgi:hypothetical protein
MIGRPGTRGDRAAVAGAVDMAVTVGSVWLANPIMTPSSPPTATWLPWGRWW